MKVITIKVKIFPKGQVTNSIQSSKPILPSTEKNNKPRCLDILNKIKQKNQSVKNKLIKK